MPVGGIRRTQAQWQTVLSAQSDWRTNSRPSYTSADADTLRGLKLGLHSAIRYGKNVECLSARIGADWVTVTFQRVKTRQTTSLFSRTRQDCGNFPQILRRCSAFVITSYLEPVPPALLYRYHSIPLAGLWNSFLLPPLLCSRLARLLSLADKRLLPQSASVGRL